VVVIVLFGALAIHFVLPGDDVKAPMPLSNEGEAVSTMPLNEDQDAAFSNDADLTLPSVADEMRDKPLATDYETADAPPVAGPSDLVVSTADSEEDASLTQSYDAKPELTVDTKLDDSQAQAAVVQADIYVTFSADCWVQLKDGAGKTAVAKLKRAGSVLEYSGQRPYSLVLGAAEATQLTYLGEPFDLAPYTRRNGKAVLELD